MNQWVHVEQVAIACVYEKIRSRNVNDIESQLKLYDLSKHYPDFLRKVVAYFPFLIRMSMRYIWPRLQKW